MYIKWHSIQFSHEHFNLDLILPNLHIRFLILRLALLYLLGPCLQLLQEVLLVRLQLLPFGLALHQMRLNTLQISQFHF